MSLYQKYRPKEFSEVVGNRAIIASLKGMLKDVDNLAHSFLFHGPTGCGKTTLARIIANKLGCTENNLIEIDTAQFRGIDTVRDIRKNAQFTPLGGGVRVYIIDEVHKMTGDAQNAFLKILEDAPAHIYFILCTTDLNSLLPTIRGRCIQLQVDRLDDDEMNYLLTHVAEQENDELDEEILNQIIIDSQGHPRNALTILEQVLNTPKKRRLKIAQRSAIEQSQSIALCQALIKRKSWNEVKKILEGLKGQDPENIRRAVMGYASAVLIKSDNMIAGSILEEFVNPFYNSGFPGLVFACYSVVKG